MSTPTKIRVNMRGVNIEFEGSEEFVETKLLAVLEKIAALGPASGLSTQESSEAFLAGSTGVSALSTATLASLINAKTGSDLLRAAAAHLSLVKGKSTASRSELHDEMKGATTYYKTSFGGNLSNYFDTLIKAKQLNQTGKDTYAQAATERQHWGKVIEAHNNPAQTLAS